MSIPTSFKRAAFAAMSAALATAGVVIAVMHGQLKSYRREIRAYQIDDLTGLYSQRTSEGALHRAEQDPGLCVSVFDLANFKLVNDALGHAEGDRHLGIAGGVVNRVLDQLGLPRRYGIRRGGDEIVVISPEGSGWAIVAEVEHSYATIVGDKPIKLENGCFVPRVVGGSSDARRTIDTPAGAGEKFAIAEAEMEIRKLKILLMQHRKGLLLSRAFDPDDALRRIEAWQDYRTVPVVSGE